MDNRIKSPDWTKFRDHIERYVDRNESAYARIIADLTLFSLLPDDQRYSRLDKVKFPSVDHVPPCIKYKPPTEIKFIQEYEHFGLHRLEVVEVQIQRLINQDPDHFSDLHPVRYDKVKEAISNGEIDMPIAYFTPEGNLCVQDGRHRTVALYKYGIQKIQIQVFAEEKEKVIANLADDIDYSFEQKSWGDCQQQKYSLQDFQFKPKPHNADE